MISLSGVKKYWTVFANSWQATFIYRVSTWVQFGIASIVLISAFYLWSNIFGDTAEIAGYTKNEVITYYILIGYIMAAIFDFVPVARDIRTGTLSNFIVRPVSYFLYRYWSSVARRILRLLLGAPILILLFVVFRDSVVLISDPLAYFFLFLTMLGAINILFFIDVLQGMIEFWILNSGTVRMITDMVTMFFAGAVIPLAFFPDWLNVISNILPFKYTAAFVVEAFTGRLELFEVLFGIGIQILWMLALLIISKIVWTFGLRKYEAYGG